MFRRRRDGLFDLCVAALCVWGAAYHTPAGAILRAAAGWAFGSSGGSRPLLSYYKNGIYDAAPERTPVLPKLEPGRIVAPAEALARAVQAVGGDPTKLDAAMRTFGAPEAAVVAVFCGDDVAAYAVERLVAHGDPMSLHSLAEHVPPNRAGPLAQASRALALATAYALGWPVDPSVRISSPFGMRTHPTLGTKKLHAGIDLAVAVGSEVRAAASGVVRRASEDALNGRMIVIDHGHGVSTLYCHNSALLHAAGARVEAGQVVAKSGNTGRSSGPHLHYQVDVGSTPIDPLAWRAAPPSIAGAE